MKNNNLLLALCSLLVVGMMFSGVLAQSRLPGVKVGDTFKYTYSLDIDFDSEINILPEMFESLTEQAKNIEWSQITISSVSGSSVTAQVLTKFKNGTQISSTEITDVATGDGNLSMFLVAANLDANDSIYLNNDYEKINETISKDYQSGSRLLNHLSISSNFDVSEEELDGFNLSAPLQQSNSQNVYWDKESGSLVEMSYVMVTKSAEVNANINLKVALVETSLYTIPEYSSIILLIIVVSASTAIIVKYNKLTKKL